VQLQRKRDEAKKDILPCETEPHREEWRRLAGSTADSFWADKIRFFETICEDAAAASRLNKTRKVHKVIRTISGKSQKHHASLVKKMNGEDAHDQSEMLFEWRLYFRTLLTPYKVNAPVADLPIHTGNFTLEEVGRAVKAQE